MTAATQSAESAESVSATLAAIAAARRIDKMLARASSGRFRTMRHLALTPGYTPTLRVDALADAYDAMQAARGDARRACR